MNPEDLDLPQAPEGLLDPQVPWSYVRPQSRLWSILKARLTGKPTDGEHFFSYVNITEADADKLIENLKKDPRGYPSVDQTTGNPNQWAEREEKYVRWLVEEYLEKPFRKKVDQKIEEAEIERRVKEIQEKKKEIADTLNNKPQPEVQPQDKLLPADPLDIPDPWEGSETIPNIVTPVTTKPTLLLPPAKEPEVEEAPENVEQQPAERKKRKRKEKEFVIPNKISPEVKTNIQKFAKNLDDIRREMSKQTKTLQRRESNYRSIKNQLKSTEFLLGQQIENYREAIIDVKQRKKIQKAYTNPIGPQPLNSPTPWAEAGPKDLANEQGYTPRMPAQKLSEGGINIAPNFGGKMLQPGIYDNPIIGSLPPNTAVVPLNRNSGKELMGQYDTQSLIQAFGETMFKPTNALIGGAVAKIGEILQTLGPFAGYFNTGIASLVGTLKNILKLSGGAILDLLGGPAYAGTKPNEKENQNFYDSWQAYFKNNGLFFPGGPGSPGDTRPDGQGEGQDSGGNEVEWAGGLQYSPPSNPFADRDGQETGIDISLKGKGSNGYGQGLTIRNPIDNLYYFDKIPKGFQNAGTSTRGVQGTSKRVAKGTGPSGFGHWATYYIKDTDGTFYELMIGHLDRPAPRWNDTSGNGVLLKKGVKIGIQGASGSSVGNTPDGTYDHMTTHINSPGRRNPGRSGQLLLQWARDLDAYKPSNMPQQPAVAGLEVGGEIKNKKLVTRIKQEHGGYFVKTFSTTPPLPVIDRSSTTPVATSIKIKPPIINLQAPPSMQKMIPTVPIQSATSRVISVPIPTEEIMRSNSMMRIR